MVTVLHIIAGLNDGGAEAVLYRLCSTDKQNRHIVVSMMDEGKYGPLLTAAGVELHCLYAERGKFSGSSITKLWRIMRAARPSVVQTWMYHANLIGGLVAFLAGSRRIIWGIRHVHLKRTDSKLSTRIIDRASAALSHWIPEQIIANSAKAEEAHIDRGYAKKFALIYNGCNTDLFTPNPDAKLRMTAEFGLNPDLPIIGCVARWTPEKDHATLLQAVGIAKRERKIQLVLIGTGCTKDNEALTEMIGQTGTEDVVTLAGPRYDVPDIMNMLDLHILSSRNEACPNVLIEAMASGTPCVSTDVGDAAHILGKTGWIADAGDAQAMAQHILDALVERDNADLWRRRSQTARERVEEHFSLAKMLGDFQSVWIRPPQPR